jgi:hypothetical protein
MKVLPMHVAYAAVLLLLPIGGCASRSPEPPVSQPQSVAEQPAAPQAAAAPKDPATPQPAPAAVPAPSAPTPTASASTPTPSAPTPAPKPASKGAAPVARAPAPAPNARAPKPAAPPVAAPPITAQPALAAPLTLDLTALKAQLRETKAIGVFTKISLKNQVDDLLDQFRDYYLGKAKITMPELRRSYDMLLMKLLSLLQDSDQRLASAIVSSREAIWGLLSDPKKFATLQA